MSKHMGGGVTRNDKEYFAIVRSKCSTDWYARNILVFLNQLIPAIGICAIGSCSAFVIGIYGLLLEFYNPGVGLPGVLGGICLLLAMYSLQMLPVSYAGLALILLGIALMTNHTA